MEVKGKKEDICYPESKGQNCISADKSKDINIKTSSDGKKCFISSIVKLNEDTLACIDWRNSKVKLVDIKCFKMKDVISLPSPWDLACLPDDKLAVTLVCNKKIQFLSIKEKQLVMTHTIPVDGSCRGIAYSKERLYVTYENDPKIEIMTLDGEVSKSFQYDPSGWPLYVALSNDASFMYVSDSSAKAVIKLSASNGEVIATYKDNDLMFPKQLAVCQDDTVLVCNPKEKSNLHLMSSECKNVDIFFNSKKSDYEGGCWAIGDDDKKRPLGMFPKELDIRVSEDGTDLSCSLAQQKIHLQPSECSKVKVVFEGNCLGECWAICYDDHTNTIFVGFYDGNKIKVYMYK